jgi:hypothetical protein
MKIDDYAQDSLTAIFLADCPLDDDPYHQQIKLAARSLVANGKQDAIYASSNNLKTFWLLKGSYIAIDKHPYGRSPT